MPEQFERETKKEQSQLTNMAIGVSVLYVLVFILLLASDLVGFQKVGVETETVEAARPFIRLNEWGDLLAGLFAPLAFLWLVVGYFLQKRELNLQIEELRKSVDASQSQASALANQVQLAEETLSLDRTLALFNMSQEIIKSVSFELSGILDYLMIKYSEASKVHAFKLLDDGDLKAAVKFVDDELRELRKSIRDHRKGLTEELDDAVIYCGPMSYTPENISRIWAQMVERVKGAQTTVGELAELLGKDSGVLARLNYQIAGVFPLLMQMETSVHEVFEEATLLRGLREEVKWISLQR